MTDPETWVGLETMTIELGPVSITIAVLLGFLGSLVVANRQARRAHPDRRAARLATLPWLLLLLAVAVAALALFTQPMEMRGTMQLLS